MKIPLFKQLRYTASRGFGLMELMITITILGIITVIAVPTFQTIIQNNRAVTLSTAFITSIHLARSEAVKRGTFVTMCPSANAAFTACGNSASWNNGWIVFSDPDNNGVIAAATDRIGVQESFEEGTTVTTAQSRITFSNTGFLASGATNITLGATDCAGNHGRTVAISAAGRPSVAVIACP